jgi:hypothetical protein
MKVHTFQKNLKRSGHMKAHNIILEFVSSGMCETNIYRENLIRALLMLTNSYFYASTIHKKGPKK